MLRTAQSNVKKYFMKYEIFFIVRVNLSGWRNINQTVIHWSLRLQRGGNRACALPAKETERFSDTGS